MTQKNEKPIQEHIKINETKWDSWADTYEDKRFDFLRYLQKKTVSLVQLKEGQRFLDIGCGTGWAVRYAASLMKENGEFYGVDLSSKMIEKAVENPRGYKSTHFYNARVEELPFDSDFFDVAICTSSFHHYLDPSKALDEIRRVLKPGGRVYITDGTGDDILTRLMDKYVMARNPDHVKLYSTGEYRDLFSRSKITYITTKVVFPEKVQIGEKAR